MEQACATIDQFCAALAARQPEQSKFAVKVPFSDGNHVEHMWLMPVVDLGETIRGTVNNQPDQVTGVRIGEVREFSKGKISDWMYIDQGRLVGGYTLARCTTPPRRRSALRSK